MSSPEALAATDAILDQLHKRRLKVSEVKELARQASAREGGGLLTVPGSGVPRDMQMTRFMNALRVRLTRNLGMVTKGLGGHANTAFWELP